MVTRKGRIPLEDAPPTVTENPTSGDQPASKSTLSAIPYADKTIQCVCYNPSTKFPDMIFTHGAGGTLNAPAMINFAKGFAANKSLLYFQGAMNVKSRTKMFHAVIEHEEWGQVLGGRSMGARSAAMVAEESHAVKALVLVSYPLKNEKGDVRDQILLDLDQDVEVLFVSGDRDGMCDLDGLDEVRRKMKAKSWLLVVRDADHGMNVKPKKATDVLGELAGEIAAKWLDEHNTTSTEAFIAWDHEHGTALRSSWSFKRESSPGVAGNGLQIAYSNTPKKKPSSENTATKSKGRRGIAAKKKKEEVEEEEEASTSMSTTRKTRSKKRKHN
jgi:predicted alpha/beta-hydrolase family hydrolase